MFAFVWEGGEILLPQVFAIKLNTLYKGSYILFTHSPVYLSVRCKVSSMGVGGYQKSRDRGEV